jgi:hypothetical protein
MYRKRDYESKYISNVIVLKVIQSILAPLACIF